MTKTNNISAYQARNALQMTDTVNQNYLKITEEIAMLKAGNWQYKLKCLSGQSPHLSFLGFFFK